MICWRTFWISEEPSVIMSNQVVGHYQHGKLLAWAKLGDKLDPSWLLFLKLENVHFQQLIYYFFVKLWFIFSNIWFLGWSLISVILRLKKPHRVIKISDTYGYVQTSPNKAINESCKKKKNRNDLYSISKDTIHRVIYLHPEMHQK